MTVEEADRLAADAVSQTRPDDLATILYTSGTTGEPKGVMLSHANLVSNAAAMVKRFCNSGGDLRLSLLPWSHVFARTCDLYTWILSGATLAIANRREQVLDDCAALQPTLINAVPYFYERLHRRAAEERKLDEPGWLRALLGDRIRYCCSGGAALPQHVAQWFAAQGVPLVQGYGLSETSPVITAATPDANKIGTVGPPLPGVEVRIAADGEIETRGPHVMLGYYKKPAATAAALKDGWFSTGDLGQLDANGYLTITGRKKELIVTAAGKNIAPTLIEGLLTADPLIHQAVVFGDGRNYLVALIVPDPDALRAEIFARRIAVVSKEQALTHPDVLCLYTERISQRLAGLSRHEQLGGFRLLDRALSQDRDELTPTLKFKRSVIAKNFAAEMSAMYGT
jgi:long-chain acyl-CoA synthetase